MKLVYCIFLFLFISPLFFIPEINASVKNHTEQVDKILSFLDIIESRIQNQVQDKSKTTNEAINSLENELSNKKNTWEDAKTDYTSAKSSANTRYSDAIKAAEDRYEEDMEEVEQKGRKVNTTLAAYEEYQNYLQEEKQRLLQTQEEFEKHLDAELELVEQIKAMINKMVTRKYKKLGELCSETFLCDEGLECSSDGTCLRKDGEGCQSNDECLSSSCQNKKCKARFQSECNENSQCMNHLICLQNQCQHRYAVFQSDGSWEVPSNLSGEIRVLVVGGGGGGANGHQGGGGSGYVRATSLQAGDLDPPTTIPITVGSGGSGARRDSSNDINGNSDGGQSSFGNHLSAAGGHSVYDVNGPAGDGGSGGGGSCNSGTNGGDGGTGGRDGGACSYDGGQGQGSSFRNALERFKRNQFSPGEGGEGGHSNNSGGGGGGGVVIEGEDHPNGKDGPESWSAHGGVGYGAGGGGGGYDGGPRVAGGDGAPGLVYIEF